MKLVIVESPAKAKTINKYLGKDYKVVASYGHVRDLPSKPGSVRPDEDFFMHYEVSPKSTKYINAIADAMKGADSIYLATDPDREGESISWHIVEALKIKKKLKKSVEIHRVVFHEITKKAVLEAMAKPRDIDMDLVNAQQARRALDYLVGFTLSPVLWHKLPGSRSAGRVQSVALRLICERENEIEQFRNKEYWSLVLNLLSPDKKDFSAKLTHLNGEKLEQFSITDEETALKAKALLENTAYQVTNIEKKQARRNPQAPFTTSSLQQDASRKLGFSTKKTMLVAQKLYEGVDISGDTIGLITYMRTDSIIVSEDAIKDTRNMIVKQYGKEYLPEEVRKYQSKAKNAQEAHEAIRPTDINIFPDKIKNDLEDEQYELYKLIWDRMAASQMESAVLNQVGVTIESSDKKHIARATGSTIHFDGFYRLYQEKTDDDNNDKEDGEKILPPLNDNDKLGLKAVESNQHFTQPPPRYTEASIVKKMEELGIGRPSTYSSIISVIQDREYVKLEKKRFIAEDRGRIVTAFLQSFFAKYVEYDFTANLEEELDHVASGDIDFKEVLKKFWVDFNGNIKEVEKYSITEVVDTLNKLLSHYLFPRDENGNENRNCPGCNKGMLSLKLSKFGAFLGCSNYPDCSYTKQLSNANDNENGEGSDGGNAETKVLGIDPVSQKEVTLRQGPYGFYLQLGEKDGKKKPKRMGIPKFIELANVDFKLALRLLELPREVGIHPESKVAIMANIGRFGPYLEHNGKYVTLKEDNVLDIGINRAVTLIDQAPDKKGREPLRVIGTYPESKNEITVLSGKYGPYIKYLKHNIKIPKGTDYNQITLEEALKLIEDKIN